MNALWLITLFSFQTKKLFSFVELDLIEHTKTASKYSRWNQLCSARKVNNYNYWVNDTEWYMFDWTKGTESQEARVSEIMVSRIAYNWWKIQNRQNNNISRQWNKG